MANPLDLLKALLRHPASQMEDNVLYMPPEVIEGQQPAYQLSLGDLQLAHPPVPPASGLEDNVLYMPAETITPAKPEFQFSTGDLKLAHPPEDNVLYMPPETIAADQNKKMALSQVPRSKLSK